MKKNILLICALVFISSAVFSQNFDFGAGLTAGTKMKINSATETTTGYGLNVRAVFNFAHKFGVLGGVSYYLPKTYTVNTTTKQKNSFLVANVDFLYNFIKLPKAKIYGLGGFAYVTNYSNMLINDADHKLTTTTFCLEAGAGVKAGPIFAEVKYQTKFKQVVATVGIYFK
jgi:hypothetical protein